MPADLYSIFRRSPVISLPLVLLSVGLAAMTAGAQEPDYLVTNWRGEEGLPHSIVNSIVQSRDGYLWVGTYVGLASFDGVRFTHYAAHNLPELGNGRVLKLFEDTDNVLWIGLASGRLLSWKGGRAQVYLAGSSGPDDGVCGLAQDGEGRIWFQTSGGRVGRITPRGVEYPASPNAGATGLGLVTDGDGTLWAGTRAGIQLWQKGVPVAPTGPEALPATGIEALALARDGAVWIASGRRLEKARRGHVLETVEAPATFVGPAADLIETRGGTLWLAAQEGTLFFRPPGGAWRSIAVEHGLRGPNRTLYEDREGNLWRGSFGGGLARLSPRLFARHEPPISGLDHYALGLCPADSGGIWALLNGHTLARITPDGAVARTWSEKDLSRPLRTLYRDRRNVVWAGSDNGYLCQLHDGVPTGEFRLDDKAETVNALFEDAQSNLWVGFSQGAGVGVLPAGDPARYQRLAGVPFPDVRSIAQGADGSLWFGTHYGGVSRYQAGERWRTFTTRDGLPSDYVRCLKADADGTIWLGTIRGLCRYRNGGFVAIRAADGLWNDSLSYIEDDGQGNFWISSFGGVFRVARQDLNDFADGRRPTFACAGYNRNDGLPSQECPGGFQPAGAKTADGRFWFPTVDGVTSAMPGRFPQNDLPPPVNLEAALIDGVPQPVGPTAVALIVPPGRHRLDFRFTAPSLTAPEKVRFRHRLEGLETEWSHPDDRRMVAYSFVPPGDFTFHVIAGNNDGVWSPHGVQLAVVVRPFFWQTWWFGGTVGLALVVGLVAGAMALERRRTRLRLEGLRQAHALERERARIARDIHDDLGASLTQISILSEKVAEAAVAPADPAHWNQRIAMAARRSIQSLDEIVWAVNPKDDTLESLANYLSQFTQEHLALAGVRYTLDIPTVLPAVALSAEVRHNLLLAAREALQNAVAHAAAHTIRVALALDANGLELRIADDGRGFDPARAHGDGKGLPNIGRRLADIGGQFDLITRPGAGTTVTLRVPRDRLHVRGIGALGDPA